MNDSNTRPCSIRIYLPDGTPDGVRIVEKFNWSGVGLVIPRSLLSKAKSRAECDRTGIYILVGQDEEGELPTIYIGQGDPVRCRLDRHVVEKDFWTSVVLFVTRENTLNKAQVGYLESRLVKLARDVKRSIVDNRSLPQPSPLSEADAADMDGFLSELLGILPLLGLNVFERPREKPGEKALLSLAGKGAAARGYESPQGFVVLAGSTAVTTEVPSIHSYQAALRKQLKIQGALVGDGEFLRFTQDYAFGSPSTAAAVVLGRTTNGLRDWKDSLGRSLSELQQLEAGESDS